MGFYNLDKKEFKKLKDTFASSYVGMKLTILVNSLFGISAIYAIFTIIQVIFDGLTGGKLTADNLLVDFIIVVVFFISAIIVYPTYINHLKKYYEETYKKKTK